MRHRLLLVSGVCPGAGKTTLGRTLADRLTREEPPVRFWSEDDLLRVDAFARCDAALGRNDPQVIEAFLAATRSFIAQRREPNEVDILDALLPGFGWLLGRYAFPRVALYRDELVPLLLPLHPLVVYLTGDPARLFERAIAERGEGWGERIVVAVGRWRLPHAPVVSVASREDAVGLWRWLDAGMRRLLVDWPVPTVCLDSADAAPEDLACLVAETIDPVQIGMPEVDVAVVSRQPGARDQTRRISAR